MQQDNYPQPGDGPKTPSYPSIDWTKIFNVELRNSISPDPFNQLVCFLKPGATQQMVEKWAKNKFPKKNVNVISLCGDCDSSLALLEGAGVKTSIQTVAGGSTSPTAGGSIGSGDSPVYLYPNYGVNIPRPIVTGTIKMEAPEPFVSGSYSFRDNVIDVAVLDTGLQHPQLDTYLYSPDSNNPPCIPNSENGFNFVARTADFKDDNTPGMHGTTVASFIIQQALHYKNNPVNILPVKVHNQNGESDLFNVLCAFAYAKKRKVKIINASFGFYVPRSCGLKKKDEDFENVLLLHKFIENYITDDVLLIAAAGNRDACFFHPYFRNLDYISFYPASFARTNRNVIAVTTVYEDDVSAVQNFSKNVVDVGVYADTSDFRFNHPLNGTIGVIGSSFAAPIVAGKIAANYDLIVKALQDGKKKFTKKNVLKVLRQELKLAEKNHHLKGKIRHGLTVHKT